MARQIRNAAFVWLGLVAVVATVGGFLVVRDRGRVAPNVEVAGRSVGGFSASDVRAEVSRIADDFARVDLTLDTPEGPVETSMDALSISVDEVATAEEVLRAGHRSAALLRPLEALGSRFTRRQVPLVFVGDPATTQRRLLAIEGAVDTLPGLPTFVVGPDDGELSIGPGENGRGIVASDVLALVRRNYQPETDRLAITVGLGVIEPVVGVAEADTLVAQGNAITAAPLPVRVHGLVREVSVADQRTWLQPFAVDASVDSELVVGLDDARVVVDLAELMHAAGTGPGGTRFSVSDAPGRTSAGQIELGGTVTALLGSGGTICCAAGSSLAVYESMARPDLNEDGSRRPVEPPLRPATAEEMASDVSSLQILQFVGGFTTTHACCQSRVTNIHRIADLVNGAVIRPGETFSLNGFVGRRTRANGFVEAGVIANGRFDASVGGGISQFATTLFNAAFFAGLDFGEYQSHSIYISRYPKGREATISFPNPDLQIRNTTPYGVLLVTEYTPTSISVSMYSTRHVEVEALGPFSSKINQCTRWTTERRRVYGDGRVVEDSVFAVYRPSEGRDCNGNPT